MFFSRTSIECHLVRIELAVRNVRTVVLARNVRTVVPVRTVVLARNVRTAVHLEAGETVAGREVWPLYQTQA